MAMQVNTDSRGKASFVNSLGTKWRCVVNLTPAVALRHRGGKNPRCEGPKAVLDVQEYR